MKKFIVFILILLAIIGVGIQFFLPNIVESQVEHEVNMAMQPTSQTVTIESSPAFKLLYGQADHIAGTVENVKLGKLNFASFHYDANHIMINPISLFMSNEIDVLQLGNASLEGLVLENDFKQFLVENVSGLNDANVRISNDRISVTGSINILSSLRGTASLDGTLELRDNTLIFSPTRFTINGSTIGGVTSQVLQPITIYDFNTFPIPVKAESVNVGQGEIHIKIRPVLN